MSPGGDALSALKSIVTGARDRLVPGGSLIVEHGYDQSDAGSCDCSSGCGFEDVQPLRDLAGIPRIVAGRAP